MLLEVLVSDTRVAKAWLVATGIAGVLAASPGLSQENVASLTLQGGETENRHTSEQDVVAGGRIFQSTCALCHGGDAKGGLGPDLTRGAFPPRRR